MKAKKTLKAKLEKLQPRKAARKKAAVKKTMKESADNKFSVDENLTLLTLIKYILAWKIKIENGYKFEHELYFFDEEIKDLQKWKKHIEKEHLERY